MIRSLLSSEISSISTNEGSHLDSHANMVVCGRHSYIISRSEKNATVSYFVKDVGTIKVPFVDAMVVYECPITQKGVLTVFKKCVVCWVYESQPHPVIYTERRSNTGSWATKDMSSK